MGWRIMSHIYIYISFTLLTCDPKSVGALVGRSYVDYFDVACRMAREEKKF